MTETENAEERWNSICRECAETGATVKGNDCWMRHEACIGDLNDYPNVEGIEVSGPLGTTLWAYKGGDVRVVANLRHSTARLAVKQLARRFGEPEEDYERGGWYP